MGISLEISDEVGTQSWMQVDRVTEDLVRQALAMMKGNKKDSMFNFNQIASSIVHQPLSLT